MNQGVIKKLKYHYKDYLIEDLSQTTYETFIKDQTIEHCCNRIAKSWNSITSEDIRKSFLKFIYDFKNSYSDDTDNKRDNFDAFKHIKKLLRFREHTDNDLFAWINEDAMEPGWQQLTDDELIIL